MLTLEEIFSKSRHDGTPTKRKILFEDGLWCIYERNPQGGVDDKYNLIHRCDLNTKAAYLEPPPIVCMCGAEAPDGILGLLNLQQWGTKDGKYSTIGTRRRP